MNRSGKSLNKLVVLGSFVLLVGLAGCGGGVTSTELGSVETVEDARLHLERNQQAIRSMKAEGVLSIESGDFAQKAGFNLTLLKPDSVLVQLEGPFGIKVGFALLTRTTFSFYNSLTNEVITGPTNQKNLEKVLNFPLSYDDVLNLFLGALFTEDDRRDPDDLQTDSGQLVAVFNHSRGKRLYYIDPATKQIVRIRHFDGRNRPMLDQRFTNYTTLDGIVIPFRIRQIQEQERRMAAISYNQVSLNKLDSFSTPAIPNNAEVRQLK